MRILAAIFLALIMNFAIEADAEAADRRFSIVTSFYPVYISTLNITSGAGNVDLSSLSPPATGCLHDYQLSPRDMKALSNASVFIASGAGMESFLERVGEQFPALPVINASEGIEAIRDPASGEVNPHVWVSIGNSMQQAANIARELAALDPSNAALYENNAKEYTARLADLKKDMQAALSSISERRIITFHEAFPYFAREFGLEVAAVIERQPGSEPNARELADVIGIIRRSGVRTIFAEPQYPAKSARIIAAETGAQVFVLDPAASGPRDRDAYIRIMQNNKQELLKALKAS